MTVTKTATSPRLIHREWKESAHYLAKLNHFYSPRHYRVRWTIPRYGKGRATARGQKSCIRQGAQQKRENPLPTRRARAPYLPASRGEDAEPSSLSEERHTRNPGGLRQPGCDCTAAGRRYRGGGRAKTELNFSTSRLTKELSAT